VKATFIHNPGAGDGKGASPSEIESCLRAAGYRVLDCSTGEEDWIRVLDEPADVIVVAGGDGTVGRVARRLVGRRVPIAILPLGTANNISKTLGIADLPVAHLVAALPSARRVRFDVGLARGPWGERHFIEGLGAGAVSCAMPEVDRDPVTEEIEDADGRVAHARRVLRDQLAACPAIHIRAALDGEDISGRYLLFEALIMQFVGPNLCLAPNVGENDGRMDVIMVREADREAACGHIHTWRDGRHWPPEFHARRGSRLRMDWTGFPMHIDDALWPEGGREADGARGIIEAGAIRGGAEFLVPQRV
jgi:diacylglycerol kinase family enzyme